MKKLIMLLAVLLMLQPAVLAEEEAFVETVLFDGTATVSGNWQLATGVNTTNANGAFDPSLITEDGYFTVEYNGSVRAVYLAFSEWQSSTWASVNVPASCVTSGDLCTATFTIDQCYIQYGSKDCTA